MDNGSNFRWVLSLLTTLCLLSLPATTALSQSSNVSSCPMDFNFVLRIPWNSSNCHNFISQGSPSDNSKTPCCTTLLSLFAVALAQHLKETSLFRLPDVSTSQSCILDFQSKLTSLLLPNNLASSCFNPQRFVIGPNICAGVQNISDWVAKLGRSTALDGNCRADLSVLTACDACVKAGFQVQSKLIQIDGNESHSKDCFYFTILYAAGVVNEAGPESNGAMSCVLAVPLDSHVGSASKSHSALVFGLTGVGVAVLVMSCLLGLYFWWERKWGTKSKRSDSGFFGVDLEDLGGSRPRVRPNTGLNLGTLADGSNVAVKKIIESDIQVDADFLASQRYLVYDYMPNGNLDDHLFSKWENGNGNGMGKKPLTWPQRKSIILDVAKGLAYLHYGVKPRDISSRY
ncbi:putative receptor-like protein kinase [Vitis vinifera]|uniref:Putative receptor-like protein kinase n=1 Tax=Vitis vinifera TaxID=29760 RepID=A0A438J6W2_VITVI|nr:putative receptor-like protein kinase [Vitis vinifera]